MDAMDTNKRADSETFEAILVPPYQEPTDKLMDAFDMTSDLLDVFHDAKKEILNNLDGSVRDIATTRMEFVEQNLANVQHYLHTVWMARKEYEKTSK
jgi:hypothetical protein